MLSKNSQPRTSSCIPSLAKGATICPATQVKVTPCITPGSTVSFPSVSVLPPKHLSSIHLSLSPSATPKPNAPICLGNCNCLCSGPRNPLLSFQSVLPSVMSAPIVNPAKGFQSSKNQDQSPSQSLRSPAGPRPPTPFPGSASSLNILLILQSLEVQSTKKPTLTSVTRPTPTLPSL